MMLVDGARYDVFARLLDVGELPNCHTLFADRGGFREATTVMPSVSGPAHLPMLTGCYPGRCNIPGIRWFDRTRYAGSIWQRGRYRSYMGLNKVNRMTREVSPEVPSAWELFPDGGGMFAWFNRGMSKGGDLTRGSKIYQSVKSYVTGKWESSDAFIEGRLLAAAKSQRRFLYAVLPSVDELAHKNGPLDDSCIEAYRSFDRFLPLLMDALTQAGDADRTFIGVTSDHGLSSTHTHFDLQAFVSRYVSRLMSFPFAWRRLFDCDAVSMVSGNGLAHLSFKGGSGWEERPDMTASASVGHTIIHDLLEEEAIQALVYRDGERICIHSAKGRSLLWRTAAGLHYQVVDSDPLGLPALPECMSDDEALAKTFGAEHPDALVQLEQLFWSERCGDVVVMSAPGFDLRAHWEYQDHKGSHGGTWWEHMKVPLLSNHPLPDAPLRNVDIFPTAMAACGKTVEATMDGRNLLALPGSG
jgi:hypothetical protein